LPFFEISESLPLIVKNILTIAMRMNVKLHIPLTTTAGWLLW